MRFVSIFISVFCAAVSAVAGFTAAKMCKFASSTEPNRRDARLPLTTFGRRVWSIATTAPLPETVRTFEGTFPHVNYRIWRTEPIGRWPVRVEAFALF
jgi:hypothetical protein